MVRSFDDVVLGSDRDTHSFLVPAYGFDTGEHAEAYKAQLAGSSYAPLFRRDRHFYVPYFGTIGDPWDTTKVLELPRFDGKESYTMLRRVEDTMPEGAYDVCLLIQGPRKFFLHRRYTVKHPDYWYRLSQGQRDCYAVWERTDGNPVPGAMRLNDYVTGSATKSGRGVIYAQVVSFNNEAEATAIYQIIVGVEFGLRTKDPRKDSRLVVKSWKRQREFKIGQDVVLDDRSDVDKDWMPLVQRAKEGWDKHCIMVPEDIESWRAWFVDQRQKKMAEMPEYKDPYRVKVRRLDWQDALRDVQEAWQLEVVIAEHRDSRFDSMPLHHDTRGTRWNNMLKQHGCSDERRKELQKMVDDFVRPCDALWERGD
jgi:hypothetical protein